MRSLIPVVLAATIAAWTAVHASPRPFAFLAGLDDLEGIDRDRLGAGESVVTLLPAGERGIAVAGVTAVHAPADTLLAWTRQIAALRQGRYVPLVVRFSDPPCLADLDPLTLTDGELDDLRRCRPGDCGLKLGTADMARIQGAATGRADWKRAFQEEFRRVVLDRVQRYLRDGDTGLPAYDDQPAPVAPADETAALVAGLSLGSLDLPGVAEYVRFFPRVTHPDAVDSFVYWARETFGGKPIVSVTHVMLLRRETSTRPSSLALSKQVYATHYRTGSLSLTAMTESSGQRYLVYVQRSHLDLLRAPFGGILRRAMERRILDEAPAALRVLRMRLESGAAP